MNKLQPILIATLDPADLTQIGIDVDQLSPEAFANFAQRVQDAYTAITFWDDLETLANRYDLPRL